MKLGWFALALALTAITAARLWLATVWHVTSDEAFFFLCSERMDLAFFEYPWGTAWLVKWGTEFVGGGALGLRLLFPIVAALASLGAFALGSALGGRGAGWWAVVLLNAAPAFQAVAVEANPTGPALAGCVLGLAFIAWRPASIFAWMAGGVMFAVALQFAIWPLVAVAAPLGLLLPVTRQRAWRPPRVGVVLMLVIALCGLTPFVMWNQAHDWPILALGTWQTLTEFRLASAMEAMRQTFSAISWPAALIGLLGAAAFLFECRKRLSLRQTGVLLLVPGMAWLYGAFSGHLVNGVMLLMFLMLTIACLAVATSWVRTGLAIVIACGMLVQFFVISLSRPADLPWAAIRKSVEALLASGTAPDEQPVFLIAQSPRLTASLNYHLALSETAGDAEVYLLESQNLANQWGLWPSYDDFVETEEAPDEFFEELQAVNPYLGRSAFYITREPEAALPQALTAAFAEIQPAATLSLNEGGMVYIYFCRSYQTLPL